MAEQVHVSGYNRTPVVQIVTWFCLAVSILAFFSHAGIKIYLCRSITIETGFAFTALVRRNTPWIGILELSHFITDLRDSAIDICYPADHKWVRETLEVPEQ